MINFRPITKNDFADLCSVLQDKNVMYAWEHAFSDEEVHKWIENCQKSYARKRFRLPLRYGKRKRVNLSA